MTQPLWNPTSLNAALSKAKLLGECHGDRICIDSRAIQPGDIFAAFKGEHTDGHNYVADALRAGASSALVTHVPHDLPANGNLIIVEDVQDAIKRLAIFNRDRFEGKVVAVTGSVGKTSTKEALHLVCSADGPSFCSKGNFNNELGAPISLASMSLNNKYAIFELGMNHAGEIEELTTIVRPHAAIVTAIESVHMEHFKSLADIAKAKGEIFLGMDEQGVAVINGDTNYADLLVALAESVGIREIYSFGGKASDDNYLVSYKPGAPYPSPVSLCPAPALRAFACLSSPTSPTRGEVMTGEFGGLGFPRTNTSPLVGEVGERSETGEGYGATGNEVVAIIGGREISYTIKANGHHQAINSVAALTVAAVLGIDLRLAAAALANFASIKGRGEILNVSVGGKRIQIIDDSYNASPASMRAALLVLKGLAGDGIRRKIAVLGDMRELGQSAQGEHANLASAIEGSDLNKLITVGDLMKKLYEAVPATKRLAHFDNYHEAKENIAALLQDGDCILFKGSHGTKVYEIVQHLKNLAS